MTLLKLSFVILLCFLRIVVHSPLDRNRRSQVRKAASENDIIFSNNDMFPCSAEWLFGRRMIEEMIAAGYVR